MKSKAKPAKGSARTKRFDVGGTVGALAGLGTLAYLMSRKKKGADGEYKPQGKFPQEGGSGTSTSKPEPYVAADAEENAAKKEALSKGMQYKKPEGPTAVEKKIPGKKPPNKKPTVAATTATTANAGDSDSSSTPSSADDVISAGQKYARIGEKNKPYPSNSPAVKTAQHRQFLQKKAGLSGKGITTPGDSNKKGDTSKGRSANPIQGTIDNAGKSMARTPQQKMSEGAREVQRRREEAEKSRYKKGGSVSSASKRADGIAIRGKTRA